MQEEWQKVPDFEVYEVSNLGRIRNGRRILRQELTKVGYYRVTLCKNGEKKRFLVHRLVAITFFGLNEEKPDVNHIDGDKANNVLHNLEWVTKSENIIHSLKNGLRNQAKGERVGSSKLTEKQVIDIKTALKNPYRGIINRLSEKYNIDQAAISRIKSGDNWAHVILEDS